MVAGHYCGMETERRHRFERLYAKHAPALLAYALRRATYETAQDAVAEAFVVVWRRLDDAPAEPLPWLYGIVRRTLANQRRSLRRRLLLQRRLTEHNPNLSAVSDGAVVEALASLSEAERELLMLIAWEGLTPAEAAVTLGCSANACRIRLHRARRKLERALGSATERSIGNVKPREA